MTSESADSRLIGYLRHWDRRRRTAQSFAWGPRGLAAGLSLATLVGVAARFWPLLPAASLAVMAGLCAVVGLLVACLLAWIRPRSLLNKARQFDRLLGLQERTSTALEIGIAGAGAVLPGWLVDEQLADTLRSAERVQLSSSIPLRVLPRDWLPAALVAVVFAGVVWLPNPMQQLLQDRAAVRRAADEQVQVLEALREEVAGDPALAEPDRDQIGQVLDRAIERLQQGELSREEVLAELAEAADRLKPLTGVDAERSGAALSQAAEGMRDSAVTASLAEALAQGDLQLAAAILQDFSDEVGEALTREQELDLAEQLADAAGMLAESNPELAEQLARAAQRIREGDIAAARQALAEASQTTGQTGQQISASRAAQWAADQIGQSGQQVAQAGST